MVGAGSSTTDQGHACLRVPGHNMHKHLFPASWY